MTTLANVSSANTTLQTNLTGLLNTYIDGATVNKGNAQVMIKAINDTANQVNALITALIQTAGNVGAV
jgi:UDP-N-acetylenolpyruvoylglucosamine reductase